MTVCMTVRTRVEVEAVEGAVAAEGFFEEVALQRWVTDAGGKKGVIFFIFAQYVERERTLKRLCTRTKVWFEAGTKGGVHSDPRGLSVQLGGPAPPFLSPGHSVIANKCVLTKHSTSCNVTRASSWLANVCQGKKPLLPTTTITTPGLPPSLLPLLKV